MPVKIPPMKLLPLLTKLGSFFTQGLDYYVLLKTQGKDIGPDGVALFIAAKMEDWEPEILGKKALDSDTKAAAARMLAGVAVNLSSD
jgi:hypothetical protein